MRIGVKTFDSEKFLKAFEHDADFFEVQAIQKNNYEFLRQFKKPIIIHAEHTEFGINNADVNLEQKNLNSLNFARIMADKNNSNIIIVHPGILIENSNCSKEQAVKIISSLRDKRFILENMPSVDSDKNFNHLGSSPEEIEELLNATGVGFCLDIGHAYLYSLSSKRNFEEIFEKFLELKPKHFHVCGVGLKNGNWIDHLPLHKSQVDFKKYIQKLPKDATITLEVSKDIEETKKDLELIRSWIKE